MRTSHIIKQTQKCLSIIEAIQRADKREEDNRKDAIGYKNNYAIPWRHMVEWHTERADRLAAISQRLQRYYFNQNAKLQDMILKQQARAAAADIWEQTKTEVEP